MKCNIKKTKKINKTLNKLLKKWEKYKPLWNKFKEHIYYKQYIIEEKNLNFTELDNVLEYRKTNINWNNWIEYIEIELQERDEMRELYHDIVFILECKIKNKDYKLSIKREQSLKYENNITYLDHSKSLNKEKPEFIEKDVEPVQKVVEPVKKYEKRNNSGIIANQNEYIVEEKQEEINSMVSLERRLEDTPTEFVDYIMPKEMNTVENLEEITPIETNIKPIDNLINTKQNQNIVDFVIPKELQKNTILPVIGNIRETKYIFHPFDGILINLNHY